MAGWVETVHPRRDLHAVITFTNKQRRRQTNNACPPPPPIRNATSSLLLESIPSVPRPFGGGGGIDYSAERADQAD